MQTRKNSVFGHFSRGASIHKRNLHHDLYDLCHQYLLRHAHYFHFCNIVVVAPEVVVVAIVAGFAAAFEKNGTVWTILKCFPHSVHCYVTVDNFASS